MNWLVVLIIVFIIYGLVSDWCLRKKFKIKKGSWTFYKHVNTFHKWVERTILLAFLFGIWFIDDTIPLLIGYFFLLYSVRALMEWKYERAEKEYIMTLFSLLNYLIFLGVAFILF